ncbi:MAG: single-stranded-DNA-specific exonuclease RecJ [bacterium]|jgi:single-stranded-DNA-specific exonuclease|nr:single-stranded-DNA-specific exonuclease RecJ [candidate division KSB1 bacterium]MDH7560016.1 single-stranded-DNA-specific exonuclease RecJ [bacterium]
MEQKWVFESTQHNEEARQLARALDVPEIIGRLLVNRGITTPAAAQRFLEPSLEYLHDPFLMKDMERAVERLVRALRNRERILVYGDYDVDGITAVSMTYLLLRKLGADVVFYIPDRLRQGYGLSEVGVREAHRGGATLIVSVDCGVTACQEVELASSLGLDVIICDHHEPRTVLPQAVAVLDPKRSDCTYPFKELAGVGVTFKLLQALFTTLNYDRALVEEFVDYVAIGSAADVVPLVDENRILVAEGLTRLNSGPRKVGLQALLETAGLAGHEIGTGQVVFIIAPRINAVGRMGDALRAVRLLTTDVPQQARNIAAILEAENRARKNIDEDTFAQALQMVEADYDPQGDLALVLAHEGWHPGVIGIVASRIVERYYRPTVMVTLDGEVGKGSARSIPGFDIYAALKQCEDLLIEFGGHKYAAGLTVCRDNVERLRARLREVTAAQMEDDLLVPKLRVDGEIRLSHITPKTFALLKKFAPFGPQNMRPVFVSRGLQVVGESRIVGNNHLKLKVRQDGIVIDAIGFNLGELSYRVAPGEGNLDIAYVIEENEYMGRQMLQLRLKDLR